TVAVRGPVHEPPEAASRRSSAGRVFNRATPPPGIHRPLWTEEDRRRGAHAGPPYPNRQRIVTKPTPTARNRSTGPGRLTVRDNICAAPAAHPRVPCPDRRRGAD